MRIFVGLDITHKSTILMLLKIIYLILHTSLLTWYHSQVYCIDITHKTQLDITHKIISITGGPCHRVPSMRILYLILLTSLWLDKKHKSQYMRHHLNHMKIHRTWYDSQVWLDITHKSGEWLPMLYNQHFFQQ